MSFFLDEMSLAAAQLVHLSRLKKGHVFFLISNRPFIIGWSKSQKNNFVVFLSTCSDESSDENSVEHSDEAESSDESSDEISDEKSDGGHICDKISDEHSENISEVDSISIENSSTTSGKKYPSTMGNIFRGISHVRVTKYLICNNVIQA